MTITEVHLREIAREVLLTVLKEGIVPSAEELVRLTNLRVGELDLSQPEFSQNDPGVEYGEEASASKFNRLSREIVGGLNALYNGYLQGEQHFAGATERTLLELQRLSRKAKSLTSRINRLLLTTERTGGLLNVVGDDFATSSLIDTDRTDTAIDLEGQTIHNNYFRSNDPRSIDAIDTLKVSAEAISVTPVTQGLLRSPGTRDSSVLDMLSTSESPWIFTASTTVPEPAAIEVRIDFSEAANPTTGLVKTYKIMLDPLITNNSLLVGMQYSIDGITWADIPVQEPIRRISAPTVYLVGELEFRYLRVVMTRDLYSRLDANGNYFHDFGIRKLAVHSVNNIYQPESTFVSAQHIVLDEDGNRKKFTKASLSVACEQIEPDTEIDYFIAFLDSTLTEGEFQRIIPLNREAVSGPQIAEVPAISSSTTETKIDTTSPAFGSDEFSENYLLEGTVSTETPEVWRNLGSNQRFYSVRQEDGRIVEDGWNYDGANYTTYIYIDETGGQDFDFGPRPITIDGVQLTGEVRLSEGIHYVSVQEENWYSLEGMMGVTTFDSDTNQFRGTQISYGAEGFIISLEDEPNTNINYRVIDPLYPYNHKLLIEGINYSSSFTEEIVKQRYKGAARYAAHLSRRVADTDLENNTSSTDYSRHAIVRADDGGGGVDSRVMVKWNEFNGESPREQFLIAEKTTDSYAEGLVFKAVLRTTNPRRSASLEGYEIKIAE